MVLATTRRSISTASQRTQFPPCVRPESRPRGSILRLIRGHGGRSYAIIDSHTDPSTLYFTRHRSNGAHAVKTKSARCRSDCVVGRVRFHPIYRSPMLDRRSVIFHVHYHQLRALAMGCVRVARHGPPAAAAAGCRRSCRRRRRTFA